jgi:glycosyltransferase involved in cell wall biosynthesis
MRRMAAVTVIVCTHNPRPAYLRRCLAALAAQTLGRAAWDLVIVDNRSEPPVETIETIAPGRAAARARVVREETLGLTPARLRGIREATGDLLVFVDDDNVLDADYLAVALEIARARPDLGAWSGQCRGGFETPPPEWTRRYWGNLVVREFARDVWSNLPRLSETMPCGAGLCVRREVAAHYARLHEDGGRRFQFDRAGSALLSGGDNDLAACATALGLGTGLMAALGLTHLIPPERLTVDYLARLADGIAFSSTLLDAEWGLRPSRPSWPRRLVERVRLAAQPAPHRRIGRAALAGRDRALARLEARRA